MAKEGEPTTKIRPRKLRTVTIGSITLAWATFLVAIMAFQTYTYTGVIAILAEWQFRSFDRFFPVATISLLAGLLVLPLAIILLLRLREYASGPAVGQGEALRRANVGQNFHKIVIGLTSGGAIVLFGIGMMSVGINEKAYRLSVSSAPPIKAAGFATLEATVRYDRLGFYEDRFFLVGRDLWLAPAVANDSSSIRYLVQVPPQKARASLREIRSGYLRPRALPGGLKRLYENAGYTFSEPTYVLFRSKWDVRWPWFSAAGQLALLAMVSSVFWLLGRRQIKELKRQTEGPISVASDTGLR